MTLEDNLIQELGKYYHIVEVENDISSWLIPGINIIVTLAIAFFGHRYVQNTIAKVALEKSNQELLNVKRVEFYSKVYSVCKSSCLSLLVNAVTPEQIELINGLKVSELRLFIPNNNLSLIDEFCDYLIDSTDLGLTGIDVEREKYFFHNLKQFTFFIES